MRRQDTGPRLDRQAAAGARFLLDRRRRCPYVCRRDGQIRPIPAPGHLSSGVAPVAELVDALDSKSSSARSAGSIPARGTIIISRDQSENFSATSSITATERLLRPPLGLPAPSRFPPCCCDFNGWTITLKTSRCWSIFAYAGSWAQLGAIVAWQRWPKNRLSFY